MNDKIQQYQQKNEDENNILDVGIWQKYLKTNAR